MDSRRHLFELVSAGYRLTTVEILYWMPDHPSVLQSFTWQTYDLAPGYPELHRFLGFWKDNIEATLHSVQIAQTESFGAANFTKADALIQLH